MDFSEFVWDLPETIRDWPADFFETCRRPAPSGSILRVEVEVVRTVEDILIQEAGIPADILARAKERLREDKDLGEALRELGALDAAAWAKTQATLLSASVSRHGE